MLNSQAMNTHAEETVLKIFLLSLSPCYTFTNEKKKKNYEKENDLKI